MAAPDFPSMTSLGASSDYGSDIDIVTSDYGSDFDPEEDILIANLLDNIAATAPTQTSPIYQSPDHGHHAGPTVLIHRSPPSALVRLNKGAAVDLQSPSAEDKGHTASHGTAEAPDPSVTDRAAEDETPDHPRAPSDGSSTEDTRSPLERFRTKPQKPLSVTDLVSPAWCELQYWYVLTKYGRKPRTAAMKQGSKVHRELEEQVHDFVPVETRTNEDRFALKLWNTILALRTLRETGLTRELEIWGLLDGQLVNGVIDEVSYASPDPAFEEALGKAKSQPRGPERVVYIADVKTRGAKTLPAGAGLRPTWMQLMLYRKLLETLASNGVDADTVFARYDLQPLNQFTDTFIAEFVTVCGERSEVHSHNNLSALWSLMITEFAETVGSVSDVLRAEFRYSRSGEIIGSELFAYDAVAIDEYITHEMSWWKGKREAVGVEVEEAFKCRVCDFAEECTWRGNKIEEATERHRRRMAARTQAVAKG